MTQCFIGCEIRSQRQEGVWIFEFGMSVFHLTRVLQDWTPLTKLVSIWNGLITYVRHKLTVLAGVACMFRKQSPRVPRSCSNAFSTSKPSSSHILSHQSPSSYKGFGFASKGMFVLGELCWSGSLTSPNSTYTKPYSEILTSSLRNNFCSLLKYTPLASEELSIQNSNRGRVRIS